MVAPRSTPPQETSPTLESAVLCESCTVDAQGRPTYRGVLGWLTVPSLPAEVDGLCAVFEVWGAPGQRVELAVEFLAPDGEVVDGGSASTVTLDEAGVCNFVLAFDQPVLETAGEYRVRVTHEDQEIGGRPLQVFEREETGAHDGPPRIVQLALCEDAEVVEGARPNWKAPFSRIGSPAFPTNHPSCVAAVELWGKPFSVVSLDLALVGPEGVETLEFPSVDIPIGPRGIETFGAQFEHLPLPAAGTYSLEARIDGKTVARRRFHAGAA